MLSNELQALFNNVIDESWRLVTAFVDSKDLTGRVDFATITAKSEDEFTKILQELQVSGSVLYTLPDGDYYVLNEPLKHPKGLVQTCRVQEHDPTHIDRGYLDFEVIDFEAFTEKYLSQPEFTFIDNPEVAMIELRAEGYNARGYFLN